MTTRKKNIFPQALAAAIKDADKPSTLMAKTTAVSAEDAKNSRMRAMLDALPMAPKRGRPITTGTTPAKDRKAKERATAAEQGGERLHVMLTPEGARNLRQIMQDRGLNKTEAVDFALARGNGD